MSKFKDKLTRKLLKKQKEHGTELREWLHERSVAAQKKSKEKQIEYNKRPRGVDRVPDRLKGLAPTVKPVSVQADDNYFVRRAWAKATGKRTERVTVEVIPIMRGKRANPKSPVKVVVHRPKASKGRKVRGNLAPTHNTPHVNPERSKFVK